MHHRLSLALVLLVPLPALADVLVLRDGETLLTTADQKTWLNRARCLCAEPLSITVDLSSVSAAADVALVVGKTCITSEQRLSDTCRTLWRGDVGTVLTKTIDAAADTIAGSCAAADNTVTLSLVADADETDQWTSIATLELGVDTERPDAPTKGAVVAGEKLAEVSFTAADDTETGTRYQVLCTTIAGDPVGDGAITAAFDSPWDRCAADGEDSALIAANACAEVTSSADSVTVTGLTDGERYRFAVVAIDESGNASARVVVGEATPAAEEDLWERYQRAGGAADGSGCRTTGGDTALSLLGVALAWLRARRVSGGTR